MLEGLFGNKSAEKVMLSIFEYGELHASAIAQQHKTALDPIKKQLERFEEAGFLTSRTVGRSKLYKFNEKNPLIKPLKEILRVASRKEASRKEIRL
jgi:hypothetical protein